MREALFRSLVRLAAEDERVCLLTGDLGFGAADEFRQRFPERFLNAGIAEQNMTGVAAGLALAGRIVFTYSIANFPTLRCLEQIRNDVCYHNANVKIVAVGGGLAYGALGASHHATEDVAILRALPNMVVVAPGDPLEAEQATAAIARHAGPCYLRLGRAGEPAVHQRLEFVLGRAVRMRSGNDLSLIATGGMLPIALDVARRLERGGLAAGLWSMPTLKPLDLEAVREAAATGLVLTLEEHSAIGGLGSAVAEALCEAGYSGAFRRIALPDAFAPCAGSAEYLRRWNGLDAESVLTRIHRVRAEVAGAAEKPPREALAPPRAPIEAPPRSPIEAAPHSSETQPRSSETQPRSRREAAAQR
jgi:transketolase